MKRKTCKKHHWYLVEVVYEVGCCKRAYIICTNCGELKCQPIKGCKKIRRNKR